MKGKIWIEKCTKPQMQCELETNLSLSTLINEENKTLANIII